MATNWCKPRNEWQSLFASWVRTPAPRALLGAAIFFDFRPVAGSLSLAPLEDILVAAETEKLFIAHAAQEALRWGPPLGFFNRVRSDHGMVDLKKGGIVVNLARVGATGRIAGAVHIGTAGDGRRFWDPLQAGGRSALARHFNSCCPFGTNWRCNQPAN
jgi:CBS domain-containing protein